MKGSDITFKGKTLEGKEISFCIVEFGNMYEGDDVVYVNSVPVLLSSIEIEDDEVAELKRKLAEVEGERDALRELSAGLIESLEMAVKIYESYGFVEDYPELGALVKQSKESIVLCKKVISLEK